ncbi:DNA repair exonuclease SbcCD nuclease subunit [Bacillus mesophilus]|uniref:DNA repair exonuclease n=1 Tax=Bacillus mesophilus TaxID=1808955 RepID=A0A6M0Q370_9BACI|nr:DNA repair exonuclease [Bacillus mesophilus]MBM7659936.1 DNA repair exonuclease SbcCD nuclease subunit [Bacillus mesophilus]NEY70797.1 DNA repair exonuclease [Bacillus mesophilus]
MKPITFLHAADLHLDSPYIGLKHLPESLLNRVQESTFISLERIINLAIKKKVDFIILAGDLFDSEQRSLRAQIRLRTELSRLEQEGIAAYIIHGNHDPLNGDWIKLEWPSNAHFFNENIEAKPYIREGEQVATLYGFSYLDKAVTENKAIQYEKETKEGYHIAILHGTISSNTDHNPYAPFILSDLNNKGFDYWALGHIHSRQILQTEPPVIYPGNIQGRHRKEAGEKGCMYVSMSELGTSYSFVATCDILWEHLKITASDIQTIDDLIHKCKTELEEYRKAQQAVILQLEIYGNSELSTIIYQHGVTEDVLEILNEGEATRTDFIWVNSLDFKIDVMKDKETLKGELHFLGDLLQHFEDYNNFDEALAPLYKHKEGRRFLAALNDQEIDIIKAEAESWILHELLRSK